MRAPTSLVWLLWAGVVTACAAGKEPDRAAPQAFQGRGFRALLRKDVLHNTLTPAPGVTLYDFHIGSQPLLIVHVGDRPGYPRYDFRADHEEDLQLASGLSGHCRAATSEHGSARECLFALGPETPRHLHAFYEALGPERAKLADGVIQSFAPAH